MLRRAWMALVVSIGLVVGCGGGTDDAPGSGSDDTVSAPDAVSDSGPDAALDDTADSGSDASDSPDHGDEIAPGDAEPGEDIAPDVTPDVPPSDAPDGSEDPTRCALRRLQPVALPLGTAGALEWVLSCTDSLGDAGPIAGTVTRSHAAEHGQPALAGCVADGERFDCTIAVADVASPVGDQAVAGFESWTLTLEGIDADGKADDVAASFAANLVWQAPAADAIASVASPGWDGLAPALTSGTLLGLEMITVPSPALPEPIIETDQASLPIAVSTVLLGATLTDGDVAVVLQNAETGDATVVAQLALPIGPYDWSSFDVHPEATGLRLIWLGRDAETGAMAGISVLVDVETSAALETLEAQLPAQPGTPSAHIVNRAGHAEVLMMSTGPNGSVLWRWFTGDAGEGVDAVPLAPALAAASDVVLVDVRNQHGAFEDLLFVGARPTSSESGSESGSESVAALELVDLGTGDVEVSITLSELSPETPLHIERLSGNQGDTAALIVRGAQNAGGTAWLLRKDASGALADSTALPLPHHLDFGADSGRSFQLRGDTLVAFGRWPWSWRERLLVEAPHTFEVVWDLPSETLSSVRPVTATPADSETTLAAGLPLMTSASGGAWMVASAPAGDSSATPCEQAGCRLAARAPVGSGLPDLVWVGGNSGPQLATQSPGALPTTGAALPFDLIEKPAIMALPGGAGLVIAPIRSTPEPAATHAVWSLDGADLSEPGLFELQGLTDPQAITFRAAVRDGDRLLTTAETPDGSSVLAVDLAAVEARVGQSGSAPITALGALPAVNTAHILFPASSLMLPEGATPTVDESLDIDPVPPAAPIAAAVIDGNLVLSRLTAEPAPNETTIAEFAGEPLADAETMLGVARLLASEPGVLLTYRTSKRQLLATWFETNPDGVAVRVVRRTVATLPELTTDRLPMFRRTDVTGDGLDDVVVDTADTPGALVVVSTGDGAGDLVESEDPVDTGGGYGDVSIQMADGTSYGMGSDPVDYSGAFIQVACGGSHSCGLRDYGDVECWGANEAGQLDVLPGPFIQIAAGENHNCGVRTDGTLVCWGNDVSGQSSPPAGTWLEVAAGGAHTCARRSDSTVACWGGNGQLGLAVPTGTFTAIAVGQSSACGLRPDKSVACWSAPGAPDKSPAGQFDAIAMSQGFNWGCGLVSGTQEVACWEVSGAFLAQLGTHPTGAFGTLATGTGAVHACAVRPTGALECWGNNSQGQTDSPPGTDYVMVSGGRFHNCALRTDGTITCWGSDDAGESTPPTGVVDVVVAHSEVCVLRADRSVLCWHYSGQSSAVHPGPYRSLHGTRYSVVAIKPDQTADVLYRSQPGAPLGSLSGTMRSASIGAMSSCVVRVNGALECWLHDLQGTFQSVLPMPPGTYDKVVVGNAYGAAGCARRTNGALQCWGPGLQVPPGSGGPTTDPSGVVVTDFDVEAPNVVWVTPSGVLGVGELWAMNPQPSPLLPPAPGSYLGVGLGFLRGCAAYTSGGVHCWGHSPSHAPVGPTTGDFGPVDVDWSIGCAVQVDGTLTCFNDKGPLPASWYPPVL